MGQPRKLGNIWYAHGLFTTRAAAVRWAEQERNTIEKGGER